VWITFGALAGVLVGGQVGDRRARPARREYPPGPAGQRPAVATGAALP